MNVLVIVPTYNERENIEALVRPVLALRCPHAISVLVVDDSSPDGTPEAVSRMMDEPAAGGRLSLLVRKRKAGLAGAYIAGIRWGLERAFDLFVQMDADLSHDPAALPALIEASDRYDFVVGSRYVPGGAIGEWGALRRLLSWGGSRFARAVLRTGIRDLTGGYNAWKRSVFRRVDIGQILSTGFCFQIELKYRAATAGLTFTELPITFRDRVHGESKMSGRIALEALGRVILLPWRVSHG